MSLLSYFSLPRLRAAQRPCIAAFRARANMSREAGIAYFEELSVPDESPDSVYNNDEFHSPSPPSEEDSPPVAPENAYPRNGPHMSSAQVAKQIITERPVYRIYVNTMTNNTITTVTRPNGNPIKTLTGGKCGFKKSNRGSLEAGHQCTVGVFQTLVQEREKGEDLQWELYLKGFGTGRDACTRALMMQEWEDLRMRLVRITDTTPIKIGGTRAKKMQRR